MRTHYDNLKVQRDAPDAVIRAAYKALSQRYHPDKNPGNPEAARVMAILNEAYAVLSDPERRRQHDAWIRLQERSQSSPESILDEPVITRRRPATTSPAPEVPVRRQPWWHGRVIPALGLIGVVAFLAFADQIPKEPAPNYSREAPAKPESKPVTFDDLIPEHAESGKPTAPEATQPPAELQAAPNGSPWPAVGYLTGEPLLASDGLSSLSIDSAQMESDVHIKLVRLEGTEAFPVRQAFIPAGGSFTMNDIDPGQYEVRYRDLKTGGLFKSDGFTLEEQDVEGGTQYSRMKMTLYKVQDGNMQTHPIPEDQF